MLATQDAGNSLRPQRAQRTQHSNYRQAFLKLRSLRSLRPLKPCYALWYACLNQASLMKQSCKPPIKKVKKADYLTFCPTLGLSSAMLLFSFALMRLSIFSFFATALIAALSTFRCISSKVIGVSSPTTFFTGV